MQIIILTIFPGYFTSLLKTSILKRAIEQEKVQVQLVNIRDFTTDKHHVTDDRPYGGGAGMVMKIEPIDRALQYCRETLITPGSKTVVALTAASGQPFTQALATSWSNVDTLVIICGHYEGVDARVAQHLVDVQVSIGPYVLTGGEPAAAVITDAVTRLLPEVLGNELSIEGESHAVDGQGEKLQFTRPEKYRGWSVPEVLLGGNHASIDQWREQQRHSG